MNNVKVPSVYMLHLSPSPYHLSPLRSLCFQPELPPSLLCLPSLKSFEYAALSTPVPCSYLHTPKVSGLLEERIWEPYSSQQPAVWHNIGPMTISGWLIFLPSAEEPTREVSLGAGASVPLMCQTVISCEGHARLYS